MNNNEQELAEFWDEFAEEYEEIQQESPFPIARELRDFWSKKVFSVSDISGYRRWDGTIFTFFKSKSRSTR